MNHRLKTFIVSSSLVVILSLPLITFAQTPPSGVTTPTSPGATTPTSPGVTNPVSNIVALQNPLNSSYNTIPLIVTGIVNAILKVFAVLCALYIIWAGFLFVSAQGNPEKLAEAKKTITHALIGTAIILGANVILSLVTATISAIKS